jgi:hypothetical protein
MQSCGAETASKWASPGAVIRLHPALAQKMHMSPIFNVDKVGSIAGRTVFDASAGKNSLNDGADRERRDEDIPAVPNPSLSDLCNMACDARKRYGRGRRLTGQQ